MLHPQMVANELWEKQVIDDATKSTLENMDDQAKRSKLLENVIVTVRLQPEDKRMAKFETVLRVLRKYIPLNVVVDCIEQDYLEFKETSTPDGSVAIAGKLAGRTKEFNNVS